MAIRPRTGPMKKPIRQPTLIGSRLGLRRKIEAAAPIPRITHQWNLVQGRRSSRAGTSDLKVGTAVGLLRDAISCPASLTFEPGSCSESDRTADPNSPQTQRGMELCRCSEARTEAGHTSR